MRVTDEQFQLPPDLLIELHTLTVIIIVNVIKINLFIKLYAHVAN